MAGISILPSAGGRVLLQIPACYRTTVTRFRFAVFVFLSVTIGAVLFYPTTAGAQTSPDLSGHWRLNPALSQLPPELGFDADYFQEPAGTEREPVQGDTRSRRSSSGRYGKMRNAMPRPESADEARRLRQLTDEARQPPSELTISTASGAVTFSDGHGYSRTFHPSGNEEVIDLGGVPVVAITRWESGQLVVLYEIEEGRQIRYAYSRTANPGRLTAEVQFIDRGTGDKVTRVYEPANETTAGTTGPAPASSSAAPPGTAPAGPSQGAAFNQKPGAEFRGLTQLGLVVEGLQSSAACGLTEDAIESAVATHLKAAGLKVLRNTDEDTYVYVNINTATVSNGLCVSRYDVSLTTHTTATMSYQPSQPPVLVEVSLFRKGNLAGGAPAAHGEAVKKDVLDYVDQIAALIKDANK